MKRLLIVKMDGIGDYVLVHNYIDMLCLNGIFADWHVTLLCNDSWASLANLLLPNVTCVPLDIRQYEKNAWYRFVLEQKLNENKFDVIIHPVYSRCFWVDSLIARINSNKKIAFAGDTTNMTPEEKVYSDTFYHELIDTSSDRLFEFDRNRVFFESITGISSYPVKPTIFVHHEMLINPPFRNYAVIVIGAMDSKRKWCPEHYAQLGQRLHDDYGLHLVLCGGQNEVNESIIIERILGKACINLVGAISLPDMFGILSASTIVIGNDTGLLHLAVALDVPVVVISNGNHLHRFVPYPNSFDRYRCALPFDVSSLNDAELNAYYFGSNIDINKISVEHAYREVSTLMGSLRLHHPILASDSELLFESYRAPAEMFYRHTGNMFHFIERIKYQYRNVMVYGFSSLGQIMAALLKETFIGYVDQSALKLTKMVSADLNIYQPAQLTEISFDVILISVLGREYAVEALLIEQFGIAQHKILRVEI